MPSSEYPAQRSKKDADDVDMGVAGTVNLLQNVTVSTQPISSLDWSPDKQGLCVCSSFDQSVRVLIVTKLNRVWVDMRCFSVILCYYYSQTNWNLCFLHTYHIYSMSYSQSMCNYIWIVLCTLWFFILIACWYTLNDLPHTEVYYIMHYSNLNMGNAPSHHVTKTKKLNLKKSFSLS